MPPRAIIGTGVPVDFARESVPFFDSPGVAAGALAFSSDGVGTSGFAFTSTRRLAFTSTGTGTSSFAPSYNATPPSQGALDSFNTGASQNVSARPGWSATIPISGYATLVTDSTPTYAKGGGGFNANMWGSNFAADQEVWVTAATTISSRIGLQFRRTGAVASFNSYGFEVTSAGNWEIAKYIGGVGGATVLLLDTGLQTISAGDSIGVTITGGTIATWYKPSAGSWTLMQLIHDTSVTGAGTFTVSTNDSTTRVDTFGGGVHALGAIEIPVGVSSGTGTSSFALTAKRALSFTSTGAGTSSLSLTARRALAFTSTGTGTTAFGVNTKRAVAFTSTGTGTSSATIIRWRTMSLSSTGSGTSAFALTAKRALSMSSTGSGTSTFGIKATRALAFSSTGTGTSAWSILRWRTLSITSTGTGTSAFAATAKRALAFSSTGTGTTTFSITGPSTLKSLTFDERGGVYLSSDSVLPDDIGYPDGNTGGYSTTSFVLTAKRALAFSSTGTGTSSFSLRAKRAFTVTSTGAATSTFGLAAKRAVAFSSVSAGTSTFSLRAKRALSISSMGVGTTTFAVAKAGQLVFTSTGVSTDAFNLTRIRALAFTSTGTGTSSCTAARKRAIMMTSTGVGTATFTLRNKHALVIASTGVGASSFAPTARRALALTSTGGAASTFGFTVIGLVTKGYTRSLDQLFYSNNSADAPYRGSTSSDELVNYATSGDV